MSQLVETLSWDTEFFGFPVGRVDLDGVTAKTLREIDAEARAKEIECLYASLDPSRGSTAQLIQGFGYRLVEVALTFSRPPGPFSPPPTDSTVRRGTASDLPSLDEAITTLAPWSRFGSDPRFGRDSARRMHQAWVDRAARSEEDQWMLLVAEDETGVTGFSTHVASPEPRIDLMGVTEQGSGASWALMSYAVQWAGESTLYGGPIAARNIAPLRFVEHCGFAVSRIRYLFHRWLDEDVVASA